MLLKPRLPVLRYAPLVQAVQVTTLNNNAYQNKMLGGEKMNQDKMRCPCCNKCIGVFVASDSKNSMAKVLSKPIDAIGKKEHIFETICPRCKEKIFVSMSFKG